MNRICCQRRVALEPIQVCLVSVMLAIGFSQPALQAKGDDAAKPIAGAVVSTGDVVVPLPQVAQGMLSDLPEGVHVVLAFPSEEQLQAFQQSDVSQLEDQILNTPMYYREAASSLSTSASHEPHVALFKDLVTNLKNHLADGGTMNFATACGDQLARGFLLGSGETVGVALTVAMMKRSGTNCPWFHACDSSCSWMVCLQCQEGITHWNHEYVEVWGSCKRDPALCWCY